MMSRHFNKITVAILLLFIFLTIGGLSAEWIYPLYPQETIGDQKIEIGAFKYGQLYITEINITSGNYANAVFTKTGETKMSAQVELLDALTSSVSVDIVFYNATNVSYYYDKAEVLYTNNENIAFMVSGISQKDDVASNTYKTITLTFAYDGSISVAELLSEINFKFTVDKDSIGEVVAQTAVDRFYVILNDETLHKQLTDAMDSQGNTFNKGSAVTYIGNVAGATDDDSSLITDLFTEEFMQIDLDGDGVEEPITMMIKRENLDNDTATGEDYSYTSGWGGNNVTTVRGVEMTLYITAEQIRNSDIVVYAAAYTKLPDTTEWIQLLPLTKGTAETNNYSSGAWGTANSFNTDTWRSDDNKTIEELVAG